MQVEAFPDDNPVCSVCNDQRMSLMYLILFSI